MDKNARQHRFLILMSLAICLFIYLDSYWLPTQQTVELVQGLVEYHTGKRGSGRTYTMKIEEKDYDIPRNLFYALNINQEVVIEKSAFSGALQKVGVIKESEIWVYEAGYARARIGRLAIPIVILGAFAVLVFFTKMPTIKGRANLSYALFICSLLLFFAHIHLTLF